MAHERIHVDITGEPALRELVEEVRAKGTPVILQIEQEDVAVLAPAKIAKKRRTGVLNPDDPLFDLVGAFESNVPGGVSGDKHAALLRAKRDHSA